MAVDVYLYDTAKRLRAVALWGISKLIHDERDFMLTAELVNSHAVRPGEYIGFTCVDGRYRMFKAERAVVHPAAGFTSITATEAAVAELAKSILPEARLENATADEMTAAVLAGSGFEIGNSTQGRAAALEQYRAKRWRALRDIESACGVRIIPYYEMENGKIVRKVVDIEEKIYQRTGRILQRQTDATDIQIAYQDGAIARMYGVGASTGTEDPPSCVSFADVEWSKANGDPMDKPKGQAYLENPDVRARGIEDEDVFEDKNITDPNVLLEETRRVLLKRSRPKVSGTATAFDVAHIPGYEHKSVRIYDILDVPDDAGGTVEGIVIDVQRNYLRQEQTQIVLGEEDEGEATTEKLLAKVMNQTTSLKGSAGAAASRYLENKHLIQLNANRIVMNADEILANADRIRLVASNLEEYEKGTDERLTIAELTLYGDGTSAQAGLVARVEDHDGEISRAALTLYGDGTSANAGLVANVARNEEGLATQNAALLDLKADTESATATLSARVGENEAAITATANELQSELELKADKITLNGYVTASQLKTEFTNFENGISDSLYVAALSANGFECSSFAFKGYGMSLKSTDYVKSVGRTKRYVKSPADLTIEIWEISSISNGTLYYMSWE